MKKGDVLLNLTLFGATIVLAWREQWTTRDIIWSLWISSLVIGYSFIVAAIVSMLVRQKMFDGAAAGRKKSRRAKYGISAISARLVPPANDSGNFSWGLFVLSLPLAAFLLAFFTFHFGMFHFVHGIFLSFFFPLLPVAEGTQGMGDPAVNMPDVVFTCLRNYWPFVAVSGLSRLADYAKAIAGASSNVMSMPYANVVRMHLMIFVFAGIYATGLQSIALYLVLFFYFFPFRDVFSWLGMKNRNAKDKPGSEADASASETAD